MLGRDLEALIDRARSSKKSLGDSFVSVEHLLLGFVDDKRFGQQLLKDFRLTRQALDKAISAVRGKQNVVDQVSRHTQGGPHAGNSQDVLLTLATHCRRLRLGHRGYVGQVSRLRRVVVGMRFVCFSLFLVLESFGSSFQTQSTANCARR
jgi:ATP-dependent Clp protease ATP-binding subunit ClpA